MNVLDLRFETEEPTLTGYLVIKRFLVNYVNTSLLIEFVSGGCAIWRKNCGSYVLNCRRPALTKIPLTRVGV